MAELKKYFKSLKPVQHFSLLLLAFGLFVLLPAVTYFILNLNLFIDDLKKIQEVNLKIAELENSRLLKEELPVCRDQNYYLENIKLLSQKYNLIMNFSEVAVPQDKQNNYIMQFQGSYLDFLAFLTAYVENEFPYQIAAINVLRAGNLNIELVLNFTETI